MLNLVMLAALNRMDERELHLRGSQRTGVTKEEIRSLIHIVGIYCGVPAAVACFRIANRVFKELDGEEHDEKIKHLGPEGQALGCPSKGPATQACECEVTKVI